MATYKELYGSDESLDPAFPVDVRNTYTGEICGQEKGITKREYFASKIIVSILNYEGHKAFNNSDEGFKNYIESMVKKSFVVADIMIKESKK